MGHDRHMTPPDVRHRSEHTRHWLVVVGAACLVVSGQFIFLSPSILNPPLAEALEAGLSEVMVYNSLMAVSGVVSMMILGPVLYRRLGVRASVIGGGALFAVLVAAVAFVTNLATLYALGFVGGLVFGLATTMASSMLVNTWFEEKRGSVMGAVFALGGLGGIGAGLILPPLLTGVGWRGGFLFLGGVVVALVVLPGVFLIRSRPRDVGLRPYGAAPAEPVVSGSADVHLPGVPARTAYRTLQFAALTLGVLLVGAVMAVQMHFVPIMVERGVDLAVAGTLLSLMALASVATNIILGTLNDRRGTLFAASLSLLCFGIGLLAYVFAVGYLPLAVSTVLVAFGVAFPGVLLPIIVLQMFGMRDYPRILGPVMAMLPAGVAVGTPLWGVAVDATGSYALALLVAVGAIAVALVALAWAIPSAARLRERVAREQGQTYAVG